jgi:hypothetical protein
MSETTADFSHAQPIAPADRLAQLLSQESQGHRAADAAEIHILLVPRNRERPRHPALLTPITPITERPFGYYHHNNIINFDRSTCDNSVTIEF